MDDRSVGGEWMDGNRYVVEQVNWGAWVLGVGMGGWWMDRWMDGWLGR